MSIYLLLEERCGALTPEQLDLVMAMRDDSQRLTDIIGDLLDLNKASKSGALVTEPHAPKRSGGGLKGASEGKTAAAYPAGALAWTAWNRASWKPWYFASTAR
ncbi:MAG: hypothetical protein BWY31_01233 [Lentisphaerae bacterium ADurb.Bin242]|nr:MAG: hypothetical protein BWY31_01233 [Lentisphaerae bacterium ADurb.Bin242]